MPRMPNGDLVRKVRVATRDKPAIGVRGGTADRGDMARVDVFREVDARGRTRFHLVPVYPHQIATMERPPDRAVVAYKADQDWTPVERPGFEFRFSLYHNSLVEATKPDGEVIGGYFKGLHRGTGAITIASHKSQRELVAGIGAKTLLSLRKLDVNRLGSVSEVPRETRTWRGAVCT
jgi:CRISPR-associated endonuclease Csn1